MPKPMKYAIPFELISIPKKSDKKADNAPAKGPNSIEQSAVGMKLKLMRIMGVWMDKKRAMTIVRAMRSAIVTKIFVLKKCFFIKKEHVLSFVTHLRAN